MSQIEHIHARGRLVACDAVPDLLRRVGEPNLERVFLRLTGHGLRD